MEVKEGTELRVWFRDEIESILASVSAAKLSSLAQSEDNHEDYRRGVIDTVNSIALAFAIDPIVRNTHRVPECQT